MNFTLKLGWAVFLGGNMLYAGSIGAAEQQLHIRAKSEKNDKVAKSAALDDTETAADTEFHIGLSPDAIKKVERNERIEIYRKKLANNTTASQTWSELSAAQRTKTLADLAMTKESSPARTKSIKELGLLSESEDSEREGLMSLARVAVMDSDGCIRALARKALTARGDTKILTPLTSVLASNDALVRYNAAAALKEFGGPKVFEVIIEHWKETWGPGARSNIFIGVQRSYVADYDISGDSYDPVVKTFMTGVVLDVKPVRVEGDRYYTTIREIAPDGVKLPNDPVAWKNWLGKEKNKLTEDGRQKHVAAIALLTDDLVE